jgi:hypothetical protein
MAPYDAEDDSEKARLEDRYKPSLDLRSIFDHDAFALAASQNQNEEKKRGTSRHEVAFFSGWLWKRYQGDGGGVNWKKRWFYLMDDRLCYTRTGNEVDETCVVRYIPLDRIALRAKWVPKGNAPTVGIASVRPKTMPPGLRLAGAGAGNDRCFQLQCGTVTHVLAADTDALAARWMEKINDAFLICVSQCSRSLVTATEGERWKHECARLRRELTQAKEALAILENRTG